jgi:Cu(I)/Ag(I) efflux system membrane protein CusA/SilA
MIRGIIRFSAHNRVLVLMVTAVAVAYGVYTLQHIPVDAIPDLSDTQVIVYSRWDRSPDIMEDQVTYPIVTRAPRRAQQSRSSAASRTSASATST